MVAQKVIGNKLDLDTFEFPVSYITPEVGMVATYCGYSDRKVYDIVAMSATGKKLTLRERKEILVEKPQMIPGGFAGIVTKDAVWKTEENLKGSLIQATYRAKFERFQKVGSGKHDGQLLLNVDSYNYDYGF